MGTALLPRALVVEDDLIIRMGVVDICGAAGLIVDEAANADEALEVLSSRNRFDLLLTDIDMPGSMNGIALAWQARALDPEIAVIVVSGKMVAPMDTLPPGSKFFAKPVLEADVVCAIAELVAR